jgi:acyl carrier protein
MPTPVTSDDLRAFLHEELSIEDAFGDDDALFSSGMLDSVAMMNLIAFLEEKTGSDVRPADVTLDNFDTLTRIISYAATLD